MKMKCAHPLMIIIVAMLLAAAKETRADVTNVIVSALATIRDGANAGVDIDEATLGYAMVKYSTSGSMAKTYYKFGLVGANPDTNGTATLTVWRYSNSNAQHVKVWVLNQAWPAFTNAPGGVAGFMVWTNAAANDLGNNDMVTDPTNTYAATLLTDIIVPNSFVSFDIPLPGGKSGWGQGLISDSLVLVLTATADPTNGSSGLRLNAVNPANLPTLTFNTRTGNLAPRISAISDQTVAQGQPGQKITFTIGDPEDPADRLSVWASSSSETVVPAASFVYSGTSSNRALNFTANLPGTTIVTVHVTDSLALESTSFFTVNVVPDPQISAPPVSFTRLNTPTTPIPLQIYSAVTPVANLSVHSISQNPELVLDSGTTIAGSGTNRTMTITPVAGQTGAVPLILWVSDGVNSNQTTLSVMILPAPNVIFCEHFDYGNGLLLALGGGLWTQRVSGTTKLTIDSQQAVISGAAGSWESGLAPLATGPYAAGNRSVFYTSLKAAWMNMPGNSTGPFVHLYDSAANLLAKVHIVTNNLPEGVFHLGIASGPNNTYTDLPLDLTTNVIYSIVSRYDMDAGISALWINAASETATSVLSADVPAPGAVAQVGLRNQAGMGMAQVDDLQVAVVVRPAIMGIQVTNGNVLIDFAAGANDVTTDFGVLGAITVSGAYTDVAASITLLGNGAFRAILPLSGSQSFYLLKRQSFHFK